MNVSRIKFNVKSPPKVVIDSVYHEIYDDGSNCTVAFDEGQIGLPLATQAHGDFTVFIAQSLDKRLVFYEDLQDKEAKVCVQGRSLGAMSVLQRVGRQ